MEEKNETISSYFSPCVLSKLTDKLWSTTEEAFMQFQTDVSFKEQARKKKKKRFELRMRLDFGLWI